MNWILFLAAWSIVVLIVWNAWAIVRDIMKTSQRFHQIPCAKCRFFTGSYYLKCPVHPHIALTEDAINCPDFYVTPEKSYLSSRR